MTPFSNSRIKRRIASVMLAFWVFALGAGWANACVLQERGTLLHTAEPEYAEATTVSAGHVGVLVDHESDRSPGKAPCLKVCDDSSQSLVKWSSSVDLLAMVMAPPPMVAWTAFAVALDALRAADGEQPARAGSPIRIRYSRLAL